MLCPLLSLPVTALMSPQELQSLHPPADGDRAKCKEKTVVVFVGVGSQGP